MQVDFKVDDIQRITDHILDQLAPRTAKVMRDAMEEVFSAAVTAWPVRTGRSKAALSRRMGVTEAGITVEIVDAIDYAWAIRTPTKTKHVALGTLFSSVKGKRVTDELITKPWAALWDKIGPVMLDELGKAVRGA